MVNPLSALDGGNGNVEQPPEKRKVRAIILAVLVALGLGTSLSNVIPTETPAKEANNKAPLFGTK
jgi:hypothetical protein